MGLLTPKDKKGDKKSANQKNSQQSKFLQNKNTKSSGGFTKKPMTGGTQRGS